METIALGYGHGDRVTRRAVAASNRVYWMVGAGCAVAVIAATLYWRERSTTPATLMSRLPASSAAVLGVDFQALRRAGILDLLAGATVEEEAEYKTFLAKTGFDYRRDLDFAVAAFDAGATFMLVRGRFDWKKLESYAKDQGGGCFNALCRMAGSRPERKISYFPLRSSLMALAVSPDDFAASRLNESGHSQGALTIPAEPVWLRLTPAALKNTDGLPPGTQLFAKAMSEAENVLLSLGAAPQSGGGFEARIEVTCRSEQDASTLHASLDKITHVLREMIAKEKQKPNPADLSGVLTAGQFRRESRKVLGRWPIERAFLESLAGRS
ncbi:MAG: hypothetical protein ACRD8O_21895 [Bryobacteraceae bacterium]